MRAELAIVGVVALTAAPALAAGSMDRKPPSKPTIAGPKVTSSTRPVYRFRARDDRDRATKLRYRCSFDSTKLHGCPARYSQDLAPGKHVLRARAVDRAGNRSPTASRVIYVINTPVRR